MAVKLNSAGGGSVTLDVPSTGSTFNQTLPAVNGTVVTTGDSGSVSSTMLATAITPIGVGQTWQAPTRAVNTLYTNSTGRPIMVKVSYILTSTIATTAIFQVDGTNVDWAGGSGATANQGGMVNLIVPNGSTYKFLTVSGVSIGNWVELR